MSAARPRLLVFIVAYNAEKTIRSVLTRIPPTLADTHEVEILIIDDSSKDGTFERFEVVAFSAERKGAKPAAPSGSKIQSTLKPAFYLYAPLPGSTVPQIYGPSGDEP